MEKLKTKIKFTYKDYKSLPESDYVSQLRTLAIIMLKKSSGSVQIFYPKFNKEELIQAIRCFSSS